MKEWAVPNNTIVKSVGMIDKQIYNNQLGFLYKTPFHEILYSARYTTYKVFYHGNFITVTRCDIHL